MPLQLLGTAIAELLSLGLPKPSLKQGAYLIETGEATTGMARNFREVWLHANYVITIGVAMVGWVWFLGWSAMKLFDFVF